MYSVAIYLRKMSSLSFVTISKNAHSTAEQQSIMIAIIFQVHKTASPGLTFNSVKTNSVLSTAEFRCVGRDTPLTAARRTQSLIRNRKQLKKSV